MSKFFKWLKKDKQSEESPVVNDPSVQKTDEQADSEPELLKNNSSENSVSTSHSDEVTQQESLEIAANWSLGVRLSRRKRKKVANLENNHSYNELISDELAETTEENVKPESETLVNESVIESLSSVENTLLTDNETIKEQQINHLSNSKTLKKLVFSVN